jgi:MFS family permease
LYTSYLQTLRLFSRDIRLFLISAVLVGFAWDGVRSVLFNLYLLRLGYGPEQVGLINSVGALVFALFCLPAGAFGTRWGSRGMLIAGVGLLAMGYGLLPLAEFVPATWRMAWLLAVSVVTFLGLALYLVNGLPFTMEATGPEERNHVFAVHMALVPLAAIAGSLAGGALPGMSAKILGISPQDPAAYRYPLWLAALLLAFGVLVLLRSRQPGKAQLGRLTPAAAPVAGTPGEGSEPAPYKLIIVVAVVMALRFGGRGLITTFFNVYLDAGLGVSTALIGALAAAGQLVSVPAALAAPLLVARWGNARTVATGVLSMAVSLLPLGLVPHWAVAGFGYVTSSGFFSVTVGPIRVFSQELVIPRWRATMAAAFMMGAGLSISALSLAGGYAITALGYQSIFLAATVLVAAAGVLFWGYFRVPRGELARRSESQVGSTVGPEDAELGDTAQGGSRW